ncbi:hypothetical protein [Flaviflexus equikiangi]|uniref:Replicase polyprotein 1ab n=1 Tax=Flaviflexus equikiangi TaxID=2758573 RepID=A0ABS2THD5_9ACTO|nr:hypothetical protein [Flaviflexus equikiangi]MBM9434056.1 hypothetical protein [Flaviflexus equikiangi]
MDDNPELAYEHAKAAYRRASRIDIVREALGLTAYANEKYGEALRELRTYRRMSGDMSHAYLEADCERGMGKPERAIKYLEDINIAELEPAAQIELALVVSGAFADLEESEKGLRLIETLKVDSFTEEMRAPIELVRVERLRELGRDEEAAEVEKTWAPLWDVETIEVFDEHVEETARGYDDSDDEDSWADEDLDELEAPADEEELTEEIADLEDAEVDRFADIRAERADVPVEEPDVESDDFVDDAESDDMLDEGDIPANQLDVEDEVEAVDPIEAVDTTTEPDQLELDFSVEDLEKLDEGDDK